MQVQEHLKLLGLEVQDKVTDLKGVVTCVSFDLYGCIQVVVSPKTKDDGTTPDGKWFDVQRLKVICKKPVMDLPNYELGYVAEGKKGAAEKPSFDIR